MNRITNDIQREDFAAHLDNFVSDVDSTIAAKANQMRNTQSTKDNQAIRDLNLLKRLKFSTKMMRDWVKNTSDSIWRERRDDLVAKFQSYNQSRQMI